VTSFFGELGKTLAEKWFSSLVLPGLMLISVAVVALILGHGAALDVATLAREADSWASVLGARPPVTQALLLAAVLLASTAVSLVVQVLSGVTWRLWLGMWPAFLAAPFTARRERRWQRAHSQAKAAERNRIALAKPSRPTWMGDRIAAVENRLYNQYSVDLQSWWPRLWLTLDDAMRLELRTARAAFDSAATQTTWAFGYSIIALFWWPAALVATGVWLTGWLRGRDAVRTYAELIESTVDIRAAELAHRLNALPDSEQFSRATGEEITAMFRKGT
jgi:hypothetical protein